MRRILMSLAVTAAAFTLVSCATQYTQSGFTGGFDAKELRSDVYRVSFRGNGFTTKESVQVYWLNRCAEIAVEKGFTGFEILSDMQFAMRRPADEADRPRLASAVPSLRTRIPVSADEASDVASWRPQTDLASRSDMSVQLARGGMVFVYTGGGADIPKPAIEGDVHFLTGPVEPAPPKIFNAKALLAQLDPLIKGEKCGGNICPHVHEYLLPKGKLR
ncbi:CC0125/CC1285 family lipoprotein [Bradyrhizobium sp. USDA 4353]